MSEQIELDNSNLCIPEDAFEKFQAVSMYEESEYITLTNVMPTQPLETNLSGDNNMTSSGDTILKLTANDELHVNSINIPQPPTFNNSDVTYKHHKKRGRKKKTITESSDSIIENNSECVNISDSTNGPTESIEDIQNFIRNTEPQCIPKRRGRKPKNYNISSDDLSPPSRKMSRESITDISASSVSKETGTMTEKRLPSKRGQSLKSTENSITNVSSSNEDELAIVDVTDQSVLTDTSDSSKRIKKKRGRPRKVTYEAGTSQKESNNSVDNSESSNVVDSLPEVRFTTKTTKKRGRPRKNRNTEQLQSESGSENNISSLEVSLVYDDDDICLSNISKMNKRKSDADDRTDKIELTDLLGTDDSQKLNENEEYNTVTKKRGRPKKVHSESATRKSNDVEMQQDSHTNRSSYDDGDDVTLSEFKKTLDKCDIDQELWEYSHINRSSYEGGDDVSLSEFKNTLDTCDKDQEPVQDPTDSKMIEQSSEEGINSIKKDDEIQSPGKRNCKMPIMSDFEYNLDSIVSENKGTDTTDSQKNDSNSLLVEDVSKRSTRKKVRQTLLYHEESDEDPFANVELSDDEPQRKRKGRRYNSDDEYFPGDKQEPATPSSSDSDRPKTELDTEKKNRKRKYSKKPDSQSPRKRGRKPNTEKAEGTDETSEQNNDNLIGNDIEDCLHSSVIKTNDETLKTWGSTKEFENFLAKKIQGTNLKIKKVSLSENADAITPLQIPTIDPNEVKKYIEMCTQTNKVRTSNVDVQTGCLYDVPMKENITLTAEQSTKSCEFLSSIVNTTAELGKLMTQKSEDFIKKKINTEHVTDTFKMDYCVRKSFLLFKLAKHNLTQMEEDLAKQYEQFLFENELLKCREEPKTIMPSSNIDTDSDCEIVEVPEKDTVKNTVKPEKFNPKTVFLNKELSIKIAKKTTDDKKINIKGKHTVWINDSVLVKKVKPTQSFLAQDSRNKKPPDQNYVTAEMVSDFFEDYYRKRTLATCVLFTSPDWLKTSTTYVCNYFVAKHNFAPVNNNETANLELNTAHTSVSTIDTNQNINLVKSVSKISESISPGSLITLCTKVLWKFLNIPYLGINTIKPNNDQIQDKCYSKNQKPKTLIVLCINVLNSIANDKIYKICDYRNMNNLRDEQSIKKTVPSLRSLCYKIVTNLCLHPEVSYEPICKNQCDNCLENNNLDTNDKCDIIQYHNQNKIKSLFSLCVDCFHSRNSNEYNLDTETKQEIKSLFSLCVESIGRVKGSNKNMDSVYLVINNSEKQIIQSDFKQHGREVKSLFSVCVESINLKNNNIEEQNIDSVIKQHKRDIKSLFSICVEAIRCIRGGYNIYKESVCLGTNNSEKKKMNYDIKQHGRDVKSLFSLSVEFINFRYCNYENQFKEPVIKRHGRDIKSLFSHCVECIQSIQIAQKDIFPEIDVQISPPPLLNTPESLKQISFRYMVHLLFDHDHLLVNTNEGTNKVTDETSYCNNELAEAITINSVNTLSEEAFHSLQNTADHYYEDHDNEESYLSNDDFEPSYEEPEEHCVDDNNWASQVKMKELRSCADVNKTADSGIVNGDGLDSIFSVEIKSEPIEDVSENMHSSILVKIEPINELDEMIMIPDSVVTKSEMSVCSQVTEDSPSKTSRSYSVDTFEEFVRKNKLIQSLDIESDYEVYSQSSLRIRRQFEPDYNGENDVVDGLLIPHAYTNIYNAKDSLMESSSDENNTDKNSEKKRPAKRKAKPKKAATKANNKDVTLAMPSPSKEKSKLGASEVDELTKKMKDKIRQDQYENKSSDSELDNLPLGKRRNKGNLKDTNNKSTLDKSAEDAIQCNDVDSTEQVIKSNTISVTKDDTTNGISTSAKQIYLSKNKEKKKNLRQKKSRNCDNFKGPLELLECEPTIHEGGTDNDDSHNLAKLLYESTKDGAADLNNDAMYEYNNSEVISEPSATVHSALAAKGNPIDRCGWSCYPIDTKDKKLYQNTFVLLDKLPESFVQTYFQYQEIAEQNQVDREIDRLTNVNSLNRTSKDKVKSKTRSNIGVVENNKASQRDTGSLLEVSNNSEHEFAPSDDDEANIDDELPPSMPQRQADNILAKSSLMNDESDEEGKESSPKPITDIKKEPVDDVPIKKRPGPRSKTRVEHRISDSELVLTADKMMKEELTLLHAPVTMNSIEKLVNVETSPKESVIRTRSKSSRKVKHQIKSEDDSSSEEEKQWVSTKEKLLKKMKKAPDASINDAKRAKMVIEFIEKRGVGSKSRKVMRGKYRGSKKKFLEREKQAKVLSKELYGESSSDTAHPRKSYMHMNYKGRRNIRKVIDKKSLEISTLKANIEELERKRRLNECQNQLREHLGCEDNVNVLVINDEVCLEYDFEEDQPAVTVHAFFTKVMKAHQYEGVKFMWDTCFESLSKVQSGHPGGGCILAHCMGLGKTLQVLALLHTVLTHPQVGMKRVLVCCPLSTVLNWVDEIHKWIGPVTDQLKVFELSKLKKTYERAYQLEDWYSGGGIFIIGYELFRSLTTLDPGLDDVRPTIVKKIRTALLDPGPDIIVCDEGHLLKNDCSVLAVAMSRVATRRRIVLTGTPMQNNLREYYCMVNFIKPNLLGSYAEYSNRFANPIMNGQHRDSSEEDIKLMKTRTHILHKVLEGCLQRQEASVLYPYLPKKYEYTVFIPLTKCQWDLYKHYLYSYCKDNKQGILKNFHILQKIWSHPQVLHNFHTKLIDYKRTKEEKLEDDLAAEDLAVDDIKPADTEVWWQQYLDGGNMLESLESSNKFVAVFRILQECVDLGDKILIFSTSLFCLDSLEYFLKKINKWRLGHEYYRLDGSVPAEVRHKWCREFNSDNNVMTKLFLISTRAGSLGLNMTAANRVIILDTSWNPAHDMQSIFRVYRFGQKKDCFIYRLVAMGTMEQKIYERSVTKQAVACRVVDEQQIDRHYNSADLAELYSLDEFGGSVSGGVAPGVRDVALLRVARDGPVHAVHEHDSLLRGSEPALPEDERAAAWHQFQLESAAQQTDAPSTKKGKISTKGVQNIKSKTIVAQESNTGNNIEGAQTSKTKDEDVVNCCIPIKNETPVFFVDDKIINEIVKEVVHALIKHNFPNMQEVRDVTTIVNAVRNIVSHMQANEDNKAMISTVISKKIFQHANLSLTKLVDKLSENLNENIEAEVKQLQQQSQPIKPTPPPQKKSERLKEKERQLRSRNQTQNQISIHEKPRQTKTKRNKKNSNHKKLNTIESSDSVDGQNENNDQSNTLDNDQSSCDSSSTITADECKNTAEEPAPLTKKDSKVLKKTSEDRVAEQPLRSENSIVLSDDDDVTIVQPSQPLEITRVTGNTTNPKPQVSVIQKTPNQPNQITPIRVFQKRPSESSSAGTLASSTSKGPAVKKSKTEPVPLHPSLLTNKNFITIVAHTYLEATPLLDEDAAMLAAQYSTQKAKKEIEETGKSITSGPLYDIAVKLLGLETLEKLNKITPKVTAAKKVEAAAKLQLKESVQDLEKSSSESTGMRPDVIQPLPAPETPSKRQPSTRKTLRTEYNATATKPSTATAVTPVPQHTAPVASSNVVPVELFKGPSIPARTQYPPQNVEECILPDDDDSPTIVAEIPHPPAQIPKTVNPTDTKVVVNKKKIQPVILRTMFKPIASLQQMAPVPKTNSTSVGQLKGMITAMDGKIVVDASHLNNPSIHPTICLDSDEEEAPTPAGPVPVALTRVNSAQAMPITRVVASSAPLSSRSIPIVSTPVSAYAKSTVASPVIFSVSAGSNSLANSVISSPAIYAVSAPSGSFAKLTNTSTYSLVAKPGISSSSSPLKTNQVLAKINTTDEKLGAKPNQFILKTKNKILRLMQTAPPPDSIKSVIKLDKNDTLIPDSLKNDFPVHQEHMKKDRGLVSTGPSTKKTVFRKHEAQNVDSTKNVEASPSRRLSTLGSSSDADTPSSSNSNKHEDPLDILKNIVHIQAYNNEKDTEEVKRSLNKDKTSKVIKPSTIKGKNTPNGNILQFKLKDLKEQPQPESKSGYTFKKIAPKPAGTDLVLRFTTGEIKPVGNTLARNKASTQTASTSKTSDKAKVNEVLNIKSKAKSDKSTKMTGPVVDLTSYGSAEPTKSKDSKQHKLIISLPTESKRDKSKPKVINLANKIVAIDKPLTEFTKKTSSTVAVVDITGENSKIKSGTKVKSTQLASSERKRSSTSVDTKPPQKKKLKELTLQDFNIDDLDDIIELE